MQYQDTIIEVLVKKSLTSKEKMCRVLYIVLSIIGILIVNVIPLFFGIGYLFILTGALSFGIGFLCYYFVTNLKREYEYSIVNDTFSVDVIRNSSRRQELYSGSIREFEMVAKVKDDRHPLTEFDSKEVVHGRFISGDHPENEWYIYTKWDKMKVILMIEPDERMLKAFYRYNPRNTTYRPGLQVKGRKDGVS